MDVRKRMVAWSACGVLSLPLSVLADGFAPQTWNELNRKWGIGTGAGYHAAPCGLGNTLHHRYVTGATAMPEYVPQPAHYFSVPSQNSVIWGQAESGPFHAGAVPGYPTAEPPVVIDAPPELVSPSGPMLDIPLSGTPGSQHLTQPNAIHTRPAPPVPPTSVPRSSVPMPAWMEQQRKAIAPYLLDKTNPSSEPIPPGRAVEPSPNSNQDDDDSEALDASESVEEPSRTPSDDSVSEEVDAGPIIDGDDLIEGETDGDQSADAGQLETGEESLQEDLPPPSIHNTPDEGTEAEKDPYDALDESESDELLNEGESEGNDDESLLDEARLEPIPMHSLGRARLVRLPRIADGNGELSRADQSPPLMNPIPTIPRPIDGVGTWPQSMNGAEHPAYWSQFAPPSPRMQGVWQRPAMPYPVQMGPSVPAADAARGPGPRQASPEHPPRWW